MKNKLKKTHKPYPKTRTVFEFRVAPVFKGEGDLDYACGSCGMVLLENIQQGQVKNTVICCPRCGQYNEFP